MEATEMLTQWVAEAMKGDQEAIANLYQFSYQSIYLTIRSMLRTDEDAVLDLLQDSYIKAFQSLEQLDAPDKFVPWMKRIARNLTLDYLRKSKPVLFSELSDSEETDIHDIPEDAPSALPENVVEQKDTARLLREILDSLPEGQRAVLAMHYYQDMSVKEIAGELGKSEGTVKAQLSTGRKSLQAKLRDFEKKYSVRLYSLGSVPLGIWLFRNLFSESEGATSDPTMLSNILGVTTASAAAMESAAVAGGTAAAAGAATATGATATGTAVATGAAVTGTAATTGTAVAGTAAATGFVAKIVALPLAVKAIAAVTAVAIGVGCIAVGVQPPDDTEDILSTEASYELPTETPTEVPTETPTEAPTEVPTETPTETHTETPTEAPTEMPTETLTETPTEDPTETPTEPTAEMQTEPTTEAPGEVLTPTDPTEGTVGETTVAESGTNTEDSSADSGNVEETDPTEAEEDNDVIVASGTCGENVTWTLSERGVLTLDGEGEASYSEYLDRGPWNDCGIEITYVKIGADVSIYAYEFENMEYITAFYVDENNPYYSSDAYGVLFNKDKTLLMQVPGVFSGSYTVPDSVTTIQSSAFSSCEDLTSVWIPDSVTGMDTLVFQSCSSLTSVTIGDGMTYLPAETFYNCQNLRQVTLGDNITYIGEKAFYNCVNLTEVNIPDQVEEIEWYAFQNCTSLTALELPEGLANIGVGAFINCGLTEITIPQGVTTIGNAAFNACSSLTAIWVNEDNANYSSDEYGALLNKNQTRLIWVPDALAEYVIPETVSTIGTEAFANCSNLTEITIPSSVTLMVESVFYGCTSLKKIVFLGDFPAYSGEGDNYIFDGVTATAYYPADNDTWTEDVLQDYGGTITWVVMD